MCRMYSGKSEKAGMTENVIFGNIYHLLSESVLIFFSLEVYVKQRVLLASTY